jgi:LysM repeat protein
VTVKHGDTLSALAKKLGVNLAELKAANPQLCTPARRMGDLIVPGDEVAKPAPTPQKPTGWGPRQPAATGGKPTATGATKTPAGATASGTAPKPAGAAGATPAKTTPTGTTAAGTTPAKTAASGTTPAGTTNSGTTPAKTTATGTTPAGTTPAGTTPGGTTPAGTTPGGTTPAGTTPADTTPSGATPKPATPAATAGATATAHGGGITGALKSGGEWVADTAALGQSKLDGLVKSFEHTAVGDNVVGHFAGGVVSGLGSLVTGTVGLVGGAVELADADVRSHAADAIKNIVAHPGDVASAIGDKVSTAWHEDKAHFLGQVASNLIPAGAALRVANGARAATALETTAEAVVSVARKGAVETAEVATEAAARAAATSTAEAATQAAARAAATTAQVASGATGGAAESLTARASSALAGAAKRSGEAITNLKDRAVGALRRDAVEGAPTGVKAAATGAKSSKESLDGMLDAVWKRRAGGEHVSTNDVYRMYNKASEVNTLTRSEGGYVNDLASIAEKRPPGAGRSNVQGVYLGGEHNDLAQAGKAFATNPDTAAQLGKGFFRYESKNFDALLSGDKITDRIYINAAADKAPEVMKFVVQKLIDSGDYPGIAMAKAAGPRAVGNRAENVVIYATNQDAKRALQEIAKQQAAHPEWFMNSTPQMTDQVLRGVALGEEPIGVGGQASFGSLRSDIIADAANQATSSADFQRRVAQGFIKNHIDPNAPHLNLRPGAGR